MKSSVPLQMLGAIFAVTLGAALAQTPVQKADNTEALNTPGSWVGGVVPGSGDLAEWNSTVTGENISLMGGPLSFSGIRILNPGGNVTISGNDVLTLGGAGINMAEATTNLTIESQEIQLKNHGVWEVGAGQDLFLQGPTSFQRSNLRGTVNLRGNGTVTTDSVNIQNHASGMIDPGLTIGTGSSVRYVERSGNSLTAFNGATVAAPHAIGTTQNVAYDLTGGNGTFVSGAAAYTIRNTNVAPVVLSGALATNGILNAGGDMSFTHAITTGTTNELVVVTSTGAVDFQGVISGGNFTVSAADTAPVRIRADNTYTGYTTINSGVLQIGLGNTSGNLSYTTGQGGLEKTGAGTLTLLGSNSYSGTTTISNGAVQLGSAGGTGSIGTGNIVIGAGCDFIIRKLSSAILANQISGPGYMLVLPLNQLYLVGENTISGSLDIWEYSSVYVGAGGESGSVGTGDVNVSANGHLFFNRSDDFSFPNRLSGQGSIEKLGANTLTLTGNSSFQGRTTIDAGELSVGDGGTSGSLEWSSGIVNSGTLRFNRSDDQGARGVISGTGVVIKQGAGVLTLTGNNTYSGLTTVQEGTLQIGNGGTTGTLGTNEVSNNGTVAFNRSDTTTVSNLIFGSGSLAHQGTGTTVLTANNTYAGPTIIHSGTLQIGDGGTTGSLGWGDVETEGTLQFNRSDDLTLAQFISGTGGVTKTGAGSLTLTSNNTYSGITRIEQGILQVGDGGGSGSAGSGDIINLAALKIHRSADLTIGGSVSGNGTITKLGVNMLTLTGNNTFSGEIAIEGGAVQLGDGTLTGSLGAAHVSNNGTFIVNPANDLTFGGVVSGSGAFVKAGAGKLVVSGNNSYSGTTTIESGILQIGNGADSGSLGAGRVTNNGTLSFHRSGTLTFASDLQGTGGVISTGDVILSGNNTYSGVTNILSGDLRVTGGHGIGDTSAVVIAGDVPAYFEVINSETIGSLAGGGRNYGRVRFESGSTLTTGDSTDTTYAGDIVGYGGHLIKQGTGTFTLTRNNTDSVTFTINEGVLQIGNGGTSGSLGTGAVITHGTLRFNRTDDFTFSNVVSGAGSVEQSGNGTVYLSGNNSYGGDTRVNSGYLGTMGGHGIGDTSQVILADVSQSGLLLISSDTVGALSGGGAAGGDILLVNGSTLTTNSTSHSTFAGIIQNYQDVPGSLVKLGTGTLVLTGTNTYLGTTTIGGGILQIGDGGASGSIGSGSVTNNATLRFNRSNDLTMANTISGSGALVQQGSGTLVLTGENTYSGLTTISAGVLQIGDGGSTGILGSGDVANNATLRFNRSGELVVSAGIGGTGSLVKNGSGTVILSGQSSFSGATTINSGELRVSGGNALGDTSAVNLANQASTFLSLLDSETIASISGGGATGGDVSLLADATLTTGDASDTMFGGRISGEGHLVKQGGGTFVVTGNSTYSGTTTILEGILQVGAGGGTGMLGGGTVTNNSSLVINRSGEFTVANTISGTGLLVKSGTGTAILTGNSSYSGATSILGGYLQAAGENSLGHTSAVLIEDHPATGLQVLQSTTIPTLSGGGHLGGTVSLMPGATLTLANPDNAVFSGVIQNSGHLVKQGAGSFTLLGSNTYSGTTTIEAGVLNIGSGGTSGSLGGGTVTNNATLRFNRSNDLTVPNMLSGTGSLVQIGTGRLTLTGNNTYSGSTVIEGTSLQVGDGGTLGSLGTGAVTNNGTLIFKRANDFTVSSPISGNGSIVQSGTGTVILTARNNYKGTTTIESGVLQIGNGGAYGSLGVGSVINHGTLVFNQTGWTVLRESISGTGSVVKNGANTLTMDAHDQYTYTGATIINAGKLEAWDNKLPTQSAFILADNSGALLHSIGHNTIASLAGGGTNGGNVSISVYASLTVGDSHDTTFSGIILGNGKLIKQGAGTLILAANSIYNDGTEVRAGILQIGNGGTTGTPGTGAVSNNATLRFNRSDVFSVTNPISGTGDLEQQGTGTMILASNNTFGGTTRISNGTLQVGNGGASGSLGSGPVINNGTLRFSRSDNFSVANEISGTGSLTKEGAGVLTLAGANSLTGNTVVSAGGLVINGSVGGAVEIASGTFLGGNGFIGGSMAVHGSLRPGNSIGTLTISGDVNWFAGDDWQFELGPDNTSDQLAIINDGALLKESGSGGHTFDFAGSLQAGTFTLITWSSMSELGGGAPGTSFHLTDFSYTNPGGSNTGEFVFSGQSLQFIAIPEPSTGMLIAFGCMLITWNIRRRSAKTGSVVRL